MSTHIVTAGAGAAAALASKEFQQRSYLICTLGTTQLAVEALAVREITPLAAWTPVAGAPPLVAGVVEVRGEFVPVVDIAAALELAPQPPRRDDVLIILQRGSQSVAIVVQRVHDVQPLAARGFDTGAVPAVPEEVEQTSAGTFIDGMAMVDNGVVQLLRLDAVFNPAQSPRSAALSLADAAPADLAVLQQRAAAPGEVAGETADALLEMAIVTIEEERFGLELSYVREFAALHAVAPVPRAPEHIVGLINLRGETLPLVDPRFALGLPRSTAYGSNETAQADVVVIEDNHVRVGLIVDAVLDVRRAPLTELRPHNARNERDPLRATWMDAGGLLGVLDIERLMAGLRQGGQ